MTKKSRYPITRPIPWNKGLTKKNSIKLKEMGKKISVKNKGKVPWNKGLDKTDPRVLKQATTYAKTHKDFSGENNPFYGKYHSKEFIREQSLRKGGSGIPGEYTEYGPEFTIELKAKIRKRDNYTCQECGKHESENNKNKNLEVHHIDSDKMNNDEENLISLCKSCHVKTLCNKEYWVAKFTNKILI